MSDVHPVLRPRGFTADTRPMQEFEAEVSSCIQRNEPGLVVYADSGFGKTAATACFHQKLADAGTAVPLFAHVNSFTTDGRAAKFWRGFKFAREGDASRLHAESPFDLLVARIRVACDVAQTKRVIITLDEAQALDLERLYMVKTLVEYLIDDGYSPFVLQVGQPRLKDRPVQLVRAQADELLRRFFRNFHPLRGLVAADFLSLCQHHDAACWPANSGVTYTAYFLPDHWKKGWRMADQATPLWQAFARQAREFGIEESGLSLGAEYVVRGIQTILMELAKNGELLNRQVLYDLAAQRSGYAQTFRVLQEAKRQDDAEGKRKPQRRGGL